MSRETLLQRLRQYEGEQSQTTACYNGLRDEAADEIDRLREALEKAQGGVTDYAKQYVALRAENDRLREALESIVQWSEAYPLNIFQEPDLNEAHRLLMAGGITLDAVSASMARHVVKGVGEIARAALAKEGQ
jgi:hypothetical protein